MLTYYAVNRASSELDLAIIRSNALEDQLRKVKSDEEMKEINSCINQIIAFQRTKIEAIKMKKEAELAKARNVYFFWFVMTAAVICSIYLKQQLNIAKDQKNEVTQVKAVEVEESVKSEVKHKQPRQVRESVFEMGKPTAESRKKGIPVYVRRKAR